MCNSVAEQIMDMVDFSTANQEPWSNALALARRRQNVEPKTISWHDDFYWQDRHLKYAELPQALVNSHSLPTRTLGGRTWMLYLCREMVPHNHDASQSHLDDPRRPTPACRSMTNVECRMQDGTRPSFSLHTRFSYKKK